MNDNLITPIDKPIRDRILHTAHDLFYRDGIRATGVDKVIAESGVSKVTFYRYFPSKQLLVMAFLEYRHHRWIDWFSTALRQHGGVPGGGLTPIVGAMRDWFENPIFRGCAFINIAAEFADSSPETLELCQSHKHDMLQVIVELLPDEPDRTMIANAAAIAIDGAIVKAQMAGSSEAALNGLSILLAALGKPSANQPRDCCNREADS